VCFVFCFFSVCFPPPPPPHPLDFSPNQKTELQAAVKKDDDWMHKLLKVDEEQLIMIINLMVSKQNIDNRRIKKGRPELPSFSAAKWTDFAAQAGLPENHNRLQLESFKVPVYQLPPSFHKAVFENSWRAQDIYQEVVEQKREESKVRTLDQVCK
jgi:hypothetical protein